MIKQRTGLTIISFGVSLILLTLISLNLSGSSEAYAQATNMTQSTNVSDSIQSQNDNRSLIGSVINITNHTNPIGAAIQQMIQATSTSNTNTTSTSNTTN